MAWTNISNALVAVGAKPFATTVQALRDNPVAIAEGDATAPRIQAIALGGIYLGTLTADGTANTNTLNNLDRTGFIKLDLSLIFGQAAMNLNIVFSNNNGSSFGAAQTIAVSPFTTNPHGCKASVIVSLQTGVYAFEAMGIRSGAYGDPQVVLQNGTVTVPSNCNAFRLGMSANAASRIRGFAYRLGGIE